MTEEQKETLKEVVLCNIDYKTSQLMGKYLKESYEKDQKGDENEEEKKEEVSPKDDEDEDVPDED